MCKNSNLKIKKKKKKKTLNDSALYEEAFL